MNLSLAAKALGGRIVGRNRIACPGPGHSRRDQSLLVSFTGDDFVVHSFAGDDFRICRDHVKACLGWEAAPRTAPPRRVERTPADLHDERRRIERGLALWGQAQPIAGSLAQTYLASRGLSYDGDALRFHPTCPFGGERQPAMLGLMTDAATNEPRGVHRTALLPDGSGKAAPGKMMLGAAKGAVVRLSADETVADGLGLAEGIETALAAPFRPVWACLSAGTLGAFPVLSGIASLTIFADHDPAGLRAANDCGHRWHRAGREVTLVTPKAAGADMAEAA